MTYGFVRIRARELKKKCREAERTKNDDGRKKDEEKRREEKKRKEKKGKSSAGMESP